LEPKNTKTKAGKNDLMQLLKEEGKTDKQKQN